MHISLKWINELVDLTNIRLDVLVEKLTLGGFEVEEILSLLIFQKKEKVIDITATANRADSLSTYGIGKEISALINQPLCTSPYVLHNLESVNYFTQTKLTTLVNENYITFIAIKVENLTNFDSPNWLQEKLISSNITPVNNLSDYQNYILLETGYPFQLYDLRKIEQKLQTPNFNLEITYDNKGEIFTDENNQTYPLHNEILTVKANGEILSLAGIASHFNYKFDSSTNAVLIEGSLFNSKKIRQTSRELGIRTERSARYEKELTTSGFEAAFYRLLSLLKMRNKTLKYTLHTITNELPITKCILELNYKTLIQILGPVVLENGNISQITTDQVSKYLTRLNFDFKFNAKSNKWIITVPHSRIIDISREIDLIEEIGRLHGFNNFVTYLPSVPSIGKKDFSYQTRQKLTGCLLNLGLTEVVQYSLVTNKGNNNNIKLVNPLLNEYGSLRKSLLPELLKACSNNTKNGNVNFEAFEYGHVFSGEKITQAEEKENIAGIFGSFKTKQEWNETQQPISWFSAKGKIENLFDQLNIDIIWKQPESILSQNLLHPYKNVNIYLSNSTQVGYFGQVHPLIAKNLSVDPNTYLFEFNFNILRNQLITTQLAAYKKYSLYPKIIKDLSFIIKQDISYNQLYENIQKNGTGLLIFIEVLDEYRGEGIPSGYKSLCLQLTFQSNKSTLITKEIEKIMTVIENNLIKTLNVSIRA